ncbi:unnamed protein product [Strongylus vulgaris]|uniref:Uncharacterized protein n=1 Tax=Strongylus vulgaris TaxID=40348 RepID=A0A3P7JIY0_STRVU|nr:unnamed protein product [Strongylus vulgaris]
MPVVKAKFIFQVTENLELEVRADSVQPARLILPITIIPTDTEVHEQQKEKEMRKDVKEETQIEAPRLPAISDQLPVCPRIYAIQLYLHVVTVSLLRYYVISNDETYHSGNHTYNHSWPHSLRIVMSSKAEKEAYTSTVNTATALHSKNVTSGKAGFVRSEFLVVVPNTPLIWESSEE